MSRTLRTRFCRAGRDGRDAGIERLLGSCWRQSAPPDGPCPTDPLTTPLGGSWAGAFRPIDGDRVTVLGNCVLRTKDPCGGPISRDGDHGHRFDVPEPEPFL